LKFKNALATVFSVLPLAGLIDSVKACAGLLANMEEAIARPTAADKAREGEEIRFMMFLSYLIRLDEVQFVLDAYVPKMTV
jgi:hypothetical protein